jgi:pimeloyl-ACP methyl ester carboxylesterase
MPARGYGLTLQLHSLSANYNQYAASKNQSQFGERAGGSIVITPGGRGPDGFYAGIPEADTFEVWADVNRLYKLDPDWAAVSGYSMGGFGTFRFLARWPDLFGRGMSTVGAPGSVGEQLRSLRNTPIMTWNSAADELVPIDTSEQMVTDMTAAGIRFIHDLFAASDHLTLSTNDEYSVPAAFLGDHRADRSPAHVTYVVDPTEDSKDAQAVGDHAYWVSGLRLRDPKAEGRGTIDARSAGFGVGDPPVLPIKTSDGTVEGGAHGPMAYHRRERDWGPAPPLARTPKLFVSTTNIDTATLDATRARVGCAPKLYVLTDGPLSLGVTCATPAPAKAPRCTKTVTLRLPRVAKRPNTRATATSGGKTLADVTGTRVLRLSFHRPTRRAFSVRIRMTPGGTGPTLALSITRRIPRCTR